MPQVRLFSDSDSFTAIYASGEHKGDAKGVLLTGNNMVTHYLVIPEKVAKLNGIPRIQEAIEINTPDGKLVAVPYQQPFKLVDYVAGHEAYWTPKNSIRIAAISALESKEKYGFDGGEFVVDPSVVTEIKSYYAKIKRSGRNDDIKEIRPDLGTSSDDKHGVS